MSASHKNELLNQRPKIHPQTKFEINPIETGEVGIFGCHHTYM